MKILIELSSEVADQPAGLYRPEDPAKVRVNECEQRLFDIAQPKACLLTHIFFLTLIHDIKVLSI